MRPRLLLLISVCLTSAVVGSAGGAGGALVSKDIAASYREGEQWLLKIQQFAAEEQQAGGRVFVHPTLATART